MCLFCFSGAPIEDDPRNLNAGQFNTSMLKAPFVAPCICLFSCFCPPCTAFLARKRVLQATALDPSTDDWIDRYTCCQGYMDTPCLRAGYCCEAKCGTFCLLIESCCCFGPSISGSRAYIADLYEIRPDPCDNQLIRLSNCLNLFACICDILSLFDDSFRECRQTLRLIAQCVFYTVFGCMSAQLFTELKIRKQQSLSPTIVTVNTYDTITSTPGQTEPKAQAQTHSPSVLNKVTSKSQEEIKHYKPPSAAIPSRIAITSTRNTNLPPPLPSSSSSSSSPPSRLTTNENAPMIRSRMGSNNNDDIDNRSHNVDDDEPMSV